MVPTTQQLLTIGGNSSSAASANAASLITALSRYGAQFGLDLPHRLAHYIAQLAEESGGWKWDRELASGKEYEGRGDLGNVQPGDGVRYKGRTMGQITGRANYRAFTTWARKNIDTNAPDFEASPDLLNTDPWEGLGPLWFWSTHDLNDLADENNIEQITKRWNGGLNGFDVRVNFYVRTALVFIGVGPTDIRVFQKAAQIEGLLPPDTDKVKQVDGDAGPKTRAALHQKLVELSPTWLTADTKRAPVVETVTETVTKHVETPVAVVAKGSDKRNWLAWPLSGISVTTLFTSFADLPWQYKVASGIVVLVLAGVLYFLGDRIIRRVKTLRDEINAA